MAKTTKLNFESQILFDAQVRINNLEAEANKFEKALGNIQLDSKSIKSFETMFRKIGDKVPELQRRLSKGFLDTKELVAYNKEADSLTGDLEKLSRALRSIRSYEIDVDSTELQQAKATMKDLAEQMSDIKRNGPSFNISGMSVKDANAISNELSRAAKEGRSVLEVYNQIKARYEDLVNDENATLSSRQQAHKALLDEKTALEQQVALHERIAEAFKERQKPGASKKGYTPELQADVLKAQEQDANMYAKNATLADKIAQAETAAAVAAERLQQAKQQEHEQRKRVEQSQRNVESNRIALQNVEDFGELNAGQLEEFDRKLESISEKFGVAKERVDDIVTALQQAEKTSLDQLASDVEAVAEEYAKGQDQIKRYTKAQEDEKRAADQSTASFKNKIAQMLGMYNIYQLMRRAIRSAYQSIKELDKAMNEIAVVTDMTTDQLWGQIEAYMAVAQQYGVATKGVYEVSKLYYQQGRNAAEVVSLTAETLKMAKIAGLDYAKATDHMTVALNGFKLAAEDASMIVDVYSKLAATSATDTQELAYAMSKTASIAESAGMSFENTSVFLAQMIETTREAPENIGTAMKTIIARFQEMKKSPLELVDVEGEEVSFNRVDKALQSIGMTLQDTSGQFKNLDDVIYELADKWDTLDRNTQRYIATIVAGSRQQSRFLALMQDSERLQELSDTAQNAEDAGLIQYAKTLDSLESKLNQLSTSFQQLYMSIINGPLVKFFVDAAKSIIDTFKNVPPLLLTTIIPAIIIAIRKMISTVGTNLIKGYREANIKILQNNINRIKATEVQEMASINRIKKARIAASQEVPRMRRMDRLHSKDVDDFIESDGKLASASRTIGSKLQGVLSTVVSGIMIAGVVITVLDQIRAAIFKDADAVVAEYKSKIEKANIERAGARDELKSLQSLKKRYVELNAVKNDSVEKQQEWNDLQNEIAEKYPELISYIDTEGNYVLNLADAYDKLLESKQSVYNSKNLEYIKENIKALSHPAYRNKDLNTSGLAIKNPGILEMIGGGGSLLVQGIGSLFGQGSTFVDGWLDNLLASQGMQQIIDVAGTATTAEEIYRKVAEASQKVGSKLPTIEGMSGATTEKRMALYRDYVEGRLELEDPSADMLFLKQMVKQLDYANEQLPRFMKGVIPEFYKDWAFDKDIESNVEAARLQTSLSKEWEKILEEHNGDSIKAVEEFQNSYQNYLTEAREKLIESGLTFSDKNDPALKTAEKMLSDRDQLSMAEMRRFISSSAEEDIRVWKYLGEEQIQDIVDGLEKNAANFSAGYLAMLGRHKIDKDKNAFTSSAYGDLEERVRQLSEQAPVFLHDKIIQDMDAILEVATGNKAVFKSEGQKTQATDSLFNLQNYIFSLSGEVGQKAAQFYQSADFSTKTGVAAAQYDLSKLDIPDDGAEKFEIGADIEQLNETMEATEAEMFNFMDSYQKQLIETQKLLDNKLDFATVSHLLASGDFELSDFTDGYTKFADPAAARELLLERINYILEATFGSDSIPAELKAYAEQEVDRIIKEKQQSLLKSIADSIKFDGSKISFTEEQYALLTDSEKGGLDPSLFSEQLGQFIYQGSIQPLYEALLQAGDEDALALVSYLSEGMSAYFSDIVEKLYSGEKFSQEQIDKWINSGILDASLFNEERTDFISDAQRMAATEILLTQFEQLDPETFGGKDTTAARARGEAIQREKTEELQRSLFSSIDFTSNSATINEALYKDLKESVFKDMFTETASGDFKFTGDIEEYLNRYQAYMAEHGDGIVLGASLLHEALEKAYDSIIKEILKPSEESVKRLQTTGGFDSQATAQAVAAMTGATGQIYRSEQTGQWLIDGVNSFEAMREALHGVNINIYSFINYLDESYSGAQGLMRLEEQIADAERKAKEDSIEQGTDYWKAMAQLAQYQKKQIEMIFDASSYQFMTNSPTNEKLAPMYALFENVKTSQEVLAEASKNNGQISLQNYHAMLDYVKTSKRVDKNTLNLLSSIEEEFSPTLETKLDDDTIDAFGDAIQIKAQEDIERYNEAVAKNNQLVESLKSGTAGWFSEDVIFGGETYKQNDANEAQRLSEMVYSTLSRKDSLAVNALANYLQEKRGLSGAEAFAEALRAYQYDSPELGELQQQTAILNQIAKAFGLPGVGQNQNGSGEKTDAQIMEEQKASIVALKAAEAVAEQKIGDLNAEIALHTETIGTQTEQIGQLKRQIAEKEVEIAKLQEDSTNAETKQELIDAQAQLTTLEQEKLSLIESNANLTQQKADLQDELTSAQERISTLTEQLTKAEQERDLFKQREETNWSEKGQEIASAGSAHHREMLATGGKSASTGLDAGVDSNWGAEAIAQAQEALDSSESPVLELDIELTEEQVQKLEAMSDLISSTTDFDPNNITLLLNNLTDAGQTTLADILDIEEPKAQFEAFIAFIEQQSVNINDVKLDLTQAYSQWQTYKSIVNSTIMRPKIIPSTPSSPGVPAHAAGTRDAKTGPALVGELGPEIIVSDSQFKVVGKDGPELTSLRRGDIVLNHVDTARVFKKGLTSGQAFPYGTPWDNVIMVPVGQFNLTGGSPGGTGGGSGKNDKAPDQAEFDRWYNYLQLVEDLSRAVAELQAERENLFGLDYTKSLGRELQLLEQQVVIQTRFRDAQQQYLDKFENTKIKQYSSYLEVIDGVLQIQWDKLNGMDKDTAEPIQQVIEEWESLTESISESTQEIENFIAAQKKIRDEMRDTYIDVEKQVIDGIKYQHQMRIDNLQKELDMKVKYDNKYLESLRKNIDKERKMRERSDQEEDRAKLQRKLALLKRDTSGKSATAIAQAEEELRNMNRSAYDQRQDDFVQDEEQALLAAQEAIQNELELQTEVLDLIDNNIQLIQDRVNDIMNSGPTNLATFLTNWNQEYLNSTPTNQEKMSEEFSDLAGKVQGYLDVLDGTIKTAQDSINLGLSQETNLNPESTGSPVTPTTTPSTSQTTKKKWTAAWTCPQHSTVKLSAYSYTSQAHANRLLEEKKQQHLKTHKTGGGGGGGPGSPIANQMMMAYSKGGLIDYTGPALVHGSKQNPEAVLNPTQTGIFQNFVALLDQNFGKNIQSSMVKPKSFDGAPDQTTVIVEKIILESGVIARDYDARRAGDLIEEKILNIAKYKGNMTLKR